MRFERAFTVTFTPPTTVSPAVFMFNRKFVRIPRGSSGTVKITLKNSNTSDTNALVFWNPPITWETNTAIAQTWSVTGQGSAVLKITDPGGNYGKYHFHINVSYNGQLYSSPDPTIINREPGPPPPPSAKARQPRKLEPRVPEASSPRPVGVDSGRG